MTVRVLRPRIRCGFPARSTARISYRYTPRASQHLNRRFPGPRACWPAERVRTTFAEIAPETSGFPEEALRYCISPNTKFEFDSMAYHRLFPCDEFVIVEMSHGYVDKAVADALGCYTLNDDGHLRYEPRRVAPQEPWVGWALRRVAARRDSH